MRRASYWQAIGYYVASQRDPDKCPPAVRDTLAAFIAFLFDVPRDKVAGDARKYVSRFEK